jgi:broad specificity phosphatase PhoE
MVTRILLLRHGLTDAVNNLLAGRTPHISLNNVGRGQARALARRLTNIDRLVSSPIARAMETAEILAEHRQSLPESMVLFTEFEFGAWTGRSFVELKDDPEWRAFNEERENVRAPGGESMHDVQQRAVVGVRQLIREEPGRTVAIISHADVIRAVILHFTGTPIRNFWRFQIDPASITELTCGPERDERVVRINDCAHLQPDAT